MLSHFISVFGYLKLFLLDQTVSRNDKDPVSGICVVWSDKQSDRQDLLSTDLSILPMKKEWTLINNIRRSQTLIFYLSRLDRPFQRGV